MQPALQQRRAGCLLNNNTGNPKDSNLNFFRIFCAYYDKH